jgi:hypothetical protein
MFDGGVGWGGHSTSVTVAETRDFEFTPEAPGELALSLINLDRTVAALPVFVQ